MAISEALKYLLFFCQVQLLMTPGITEYWIDVMEENEDALKNASKIITTQRMKYGHVRHTIFAKWLNRTIPTSPTPARRINTLKG